MMRATLENTGPGVRVFPTAYMVKNIAAEINTGDTTKIDSFTARTKVAMRTD
jgi:hypothetical protein